MKEFTRVSSSSASSLRVGIVFDDTLDRPDGVQQYIRLLGRWLADQGHAVYYLVGQTKRTDIPNVHSLSKTAKVSFNGNQLAIPLPASKAKIRALLDELKLDVLHVQMPYSPLMAGKVIACARTETLVGTFHILPYGLASNTGTKLLGSVQRKNIRKFDKITATSKPAADFALSAYGANAVVVPNPVDVQAFRPTKARTTYAANVQITFLGRLVERKGAMQLLEAVRELKYQGVNGIKVRIGGNGPLLPKLTRYVAKHNLQDIVKFDGFITESVKPGYLAKADLTVFPAMSGESFGIVLTEAMAAGAGVVVGGDNPGYRSVLSQWPGCLVQSRDTQSFAESLKHLIHDIDERKRIHAEQQESVNQYDIGVVGARVLSLYQAAILHHTS